MIKLTHFYAIGVHKYADLLGNGEGGGAYVCGWVGTSRIADHFFPYRPFYYTIFIVYRPLYYTIISRTYIFFCMPRESTKISGDISSPIGHSNIQDLFSSSLFIFSDTDIGFLSLAVEIQYTHIHIEGIPCA